MSFKIHRPTIDPIHFTPWKNRFSTSFLRINGQSLPWLGKITYLGLVYDKKLVWKDQTLKAVQKGRHLPILDPLLCPCSSLSLDSKVLLYKQVLRPTILYCPSWSHASKSNTQNLYSLQIKCLRIILGAPWYVMNTIIHQDLH